MIVKLIRYLSYPQKMIMLSNVIPIGYVHNVTQYIARILPLDRE